MNKYFIRFKYVWSGNIPDFVANFKTEEDSCIVELGKLDLDNIAETLLDDLRSKYKRLVFHEISDILFISKL